MTLSITTHGAVSHGSALVPAHRGARTVPGLPGLPVPAEPAAVRVARNPGAHREPGASFWRVTWRELVFAVTWGSVRLWLPRTPR